MSDKGDDAEKLQREGTLDETIEDTFPASDPPANTPIAGTRKPEQVKRDTERG